MNGRRFPLMPLILLVCMGLYSVIDVTQQMIAVYVQAETIRKTKMDGIFAEAKYAYLQLKNHGLRAAVNRLDESVDEEALDFYVVKRNGKDLVFRSPQNVRPQLDYEGKQLGEVLEFPNLAYTSFRADEYEVTIGVGLADFSLVLGTVLTQHPIRFLADLLGTLLAILAGTAYFLRDFTNPLRTLAGRGQRRFDPRRARSAEGEALARTLATYEAEASRLAAQNFVLGAQVLSGPRHELDSGRTPPYKFACTLVRTDVNDFTSIFASEKGPAFLQDVNAFFEELTRIVSRYGGYVYEFIGDEAIFYFKDEDVPSSTLAALSALRDVNQAAAALCETTMRERGYSFFVKSSVAYGELTFGKQVRNFSLAGAPLIETVRILSHISEKRENKVYYGSEIAARAVDLVSSAFVGSAVLKGLPGERQLFQMGPVRSLDEILSNDQASAWTLAAYFRADAHVQKILELLHARAFDMPNAKFLGLLGMFRSYSLDRPALEVRKAFVELIAKLSRHDTAPEPSAQERSPALLAATVLASRSLVPKSSFDANLREPFLQCLRSQNMRVVANALEAFAWFEPENDEVLFAHLRSHENNRVRANLLLKEAIAEGFTRRVAKGFARMLSSPNPYHVASCAWALGESAAHYQRQDPIYFSSETRLQRLLDQASLLVSSENQMVSAQAKVLLKKTGRSSSSPEPAARQDSLRPAS